MNVRELIAILSEMPQDAEVWHLWDGAARTEIVHVWLTSDGRVITSDDGEPCHNKEDRPVDAERWPMQSCTARAERLAYFEVLSRRVAETHAVTPPASEA